MPTLSKVEMETRLAELEAENSVLKTEKEKSLSLKVSVKGAVSLYGIRRFPVTFYEKEWDTIFSMEDKIKEFITENSESLTSK